MANSSKQTMRYLLSVCTTGCVLLTHNTFLYAGTLADKWDVHVQRLTYDDYDNRNSHSPFSNMFINQSLNGEIIEFNFFNPEGPFTFGDNQTVTVNTGISSPNSTMPDIDNLALPKGNDKSVDVYKSGSEMYVNYSGSTYTINNPTNTTLSITGVSNGVVAIQGDDGTSYVWSAGIQTTINPHTAGATTEIVGISNGVVGVQESDGTVHVWENGTKTEFLSNFASGNTIIGMDNGIVAIAEPNGEKIIWQDEQSYHINIPLYTTSMEVVAVKDDLVAFKDGSGEAHIWQNGTMYDVDHPFTSHATDFVAVESGVVAMTNSDGSLSIWKDGVTDVIEPALYANNIEYAGMANGAVALELSNGDTQIWQDGQLSYIEHNGAIDTEVVGMTEDIIALKGDDGSVYIWQNGTTNHIDNSQTSSNYEVLAVDGGIVVLMDDDGDAFVWQNGAKQAIDLNKSYQVFGTSQGVIAIQADDGTSYVWSNGNLDLIEAHIGAETQIYDISNGVVSIQSDDAYSYIWYNGEQIQVPHTVTNGSMIAGMDDGMVLIKVYEDFTEAPMNSFPGMNDYLDSSYAQITSYAWQNGELIELNDNGISYIGVIDNEMYFVAGNEIRILHEDGTQTVAVGDFEQIDQAVITMDGQIYFNAYDAQSDTYTRYSMIPGGTPNQQGAYYYEGVETSSVNNLTDLTSTVTFTIDSPYGPFDIASYTTGIDVKQHDVYGDGSTFEDEYYRYTPGYYNYILTDPVTGNIAWSKVYNKRSETYETGDNECPGCINTTQPFEHVEDTYITTPWGEIYNLTNDYAATLQDTQHFTFSIYGGVVLTGGYTREAIDLYFAPELAEVYLEAPDDSFSANTYNYYSRRQNTEVIWYPDGSYDNAILKEFEFEAIDLSPSESELQNNPLWTVDTDNFEGTILPYTTLQPLYWGGGLSNQNIFIYSGVPEGEEDIEYYLVWLTSSESETYNGNPGNPDQPGSGIPEPFSIALLLSGLMGLVVRKKIKP